MIKSQIGWIISKLFFDKYPNKKEDKLNTKDRIKLVRQVLFLINTTDKAEVELTGNCYNQDETLTELPIPYEQEYKLS